MDVENKVVIVTGASSGVGSAAAIKLATMGARVVVNYANNDAGAQQCLDQISLVGGEAIVFQADVSDDAQCKALVQAAIEQFGQLDILINNAGTTTYVQHGELDLLSDEIWQTTLGTNLMGPFYMSRAAVPEIAKQGGGEIVMTSSIASLTSNGSSMAYCASKAALNSLTRTLAKAMGDKNIRVNAICPGLIDGKWASEGWGEQWEDVKTFARGATPLGRICTPEDIADSLISIITGTDLMTGQITTVDAGFTIY
ncbi:MAG: SDR family oxidoreductase [Halieaceae bacterium]|jgi:3-oxoacyl-[acyl-carrier protein] reductase|nr:SDR family oxidoreductase [Halieaceae bacterium]